MFQVTKWTKFITDDEKDKNIKLKVDPSLVPYKFRLLDDDEIIYAYGYSSSDDDENAFAPLDAYASAYGVTVIQYMNPKTGKYETL